MIQLNLLPDVKIAFIKARSQKRLVVLASAILAIGALVIFTVLYSYVNGVQAKSSKDLSRDISSAGKKLNETENLNKILTVQNQLGSLESLHDQKPALDRLPLYIAKTTPTTVKIEKFDIDFATKTIVVSGKASGLDSVNTYVDTLKLARYTTATDAKTKMPAFSSVVLTAFSKTNATTTYTITFLFDAAIFDAKQEVSLVASAPNGVEQAPNENAFDEGEL